MVSWKNVCKPKASGGLSFKSLAMMNRALHMKLAWGIISSPNNLWVQVLISKYKIDPYNLPPVLPTHYGSHLWRSLGQVWSEALASRRWSLGDGQSARFLWDLWVTDTVPLIAYATTTIPVGILDCKVADLVDVNGAWCWHRFDRYLPNHIILQIAALQPPSHMKDMDTFFWAHSKHGVFSTSSAYLALSEYDPKSADRDWQLVWKWKGPQSVRIFLWQAFHAGLKTKAELARRHLPISPCCDRCGAVCEDITHALRDCWLVKQFWLNIIPISKRHSFFNSRLHLWLCSNLAVNSKVGNVSNWAVFFGVAIWRIWYWRNQFLFNKLMLDPLALLVDVHTRAEEIHKLHNHPLLTRNIRTHMWISWHPPEWP